MRRWLWMLAALLIISMFPSSGTELGELRPAELLLLETDGKHIRLSTDTEDSGEGETLDGALRDMNDTAPGRLFIDTVEILVVTNDADVLLPQLKELLRPGVRVCRTDAQIDPVSAAEYLRVHRPVLALSEIKNFNQIQHLTRMEERYHLEK